MVLGAVAAIAALMALWANPAGAEDSTIPERDRSHTIYGSDSEGKIGATAINTTATASAIAKSITRDTSVVTGASYVTKPPSGKPNAVSTTALTGFPRHGKSYGILTTGKAALADDPNNAPSSGADLNGPNVRGRLRRVDPEDRSLRAERRELPGLRNDAFIAELGDSTWTTSGSAIGAPDNFAFDENGQEISINSTGAASVSAVFLDNLNLFSSASVDCQTGPQGGPTIVAVDPEVGETGVPRATNVTATFSKEMNASTSSTSTVKLLWYNKKKWKPVPCDSPCQKARLNPYPTDPSRLLKANKKHKVVVKGGANGVKDSAGTPMQQSAVWKFKTGSS